MLDVLYNTFIYIVIIALGYFLKRIKVMRRRDSDTLALIVTNLTLPAMLLSSCNGMTITGTLLWTIVMGFAFNFAMIGVGLFIARKDSPLMKGVTILSTAGLDAGNFVLPFIQTFFPGEGVLALCTFSISNTLMNTGGNYVAAVKAASPGGAVGFKDILKKLFTSVIFDTYILIIIMSLFHFSLPDRIMGIVDTIGNANVLVVMLMIGLKLEFKVEDESKSRILKVLFARILGGAAFGVLTWFLPISKVARIACIAAYFAPPATVANAYVKFLGYKGAFTSQMSVICMFSGMIIVTGLMLFFA